MAAEVHRTAFELKKIISAYKATRFELSSTSFWKITPNGVRAGFRISARLLPLVDHFKVIVLQNRSCRIEFLAGPFAPGYHPHPRQPVEHLRREHLTTRLQSRRVFAGHAGFPNRAS